MVYSKFPVLETTHITNIKDNMPGSFFVSEAGEATVVLEDGTERIVLDSLYRTLANMLDSNKVHLPTILNDIPENNTQLHVQGEIPSSMSTYSVHDIIVEVNTDTNEIIRKRLSRFTLGSDVSATVTRTGQTKPISEVINQIMQVDLSLDEYMDVNSSNKKLMVSESGCSIDAVVIRLRKMDNPMSETDEENYTHVILTGQAGLEILKGVDILLNIMGVVTGVHVEHISDADADNPFTYEYDLAANADDHTLNIVFDEKNSDIYSVVTNGVLYIKHRKFTKYEVDITTPVANRINFIKSIIMTNNGHVSQINIGNFEGSSLDINRIYYTKAQMTHTYLDSDEDNTMTSGLKIPNNMTVKEDLSIGGEFTMSETTKKVIVNTKNTTIKDTIITIGSDNDGTAPTVGVTFRSFFENNDWTKNIMDRASFSVYGGTITDISNTTVLGKRFSFTKESLAEYIPEYYTQDETLSASKYVGDLYFELDSQDVNMILANAADDIINDISKRYNLLFSHTFARFSGLAEINYDIYGTFEFKRKGAISYETWQDLRSMKTIGSVGDYLIKNTFDIDTIRYRMYFELAKETVDALENAFYFDIMPLNLYIADNLGTSVDKSNMTLYATKYVSNELSNMYPEMTIESANETDIVSGYDSTTGLYSYGTFLINSSYLSNNLDNKPRAAVVAKFEPGFLNISDASSRHKRMNYRTQMYISYPLNTSDAAKAARVTAGVAPTFDNYICILRPYVSTYQEMIQTLGVKNIYRDDFGRSVDESTDTVMRAFSKSLAHELDPVEIPMNIGDGYATINTDILFDIGDYAEEYNNMIDRGQGVLGSNKLYYYFEVVFVRNTPDGSTYNNYEDGLYINNTLFEIYDLRKEYRSIVNNSIIDPEFYNDATSRYLGTNWEDSTNVIANGYTVKGPGVSYTKNYLDGFTATLEKSLGIPYSTVKMTTDVATGYDRRLFQTNVVVNKVTNNLMKLYAKVGAIDSLFNNPGGYGIKVWIGASYIVTDETGIDTYIGLSRANIETISSDTYASSDVSTSYGLYDSDSSLEYGEPQTFVANMTSIGELFYKEISGLSDITKLYYDLNTVPDNSDIAIHIMVGVPYNIKESVYDSLTFIMSTLDVRLATDIDYKNFDPEDGYMASYAMVYRKSSGAIEFIETKYDADNEELYSSQTANIQASEFLGNASTMSALKSDLKVSLEGTLSGEFEISGYNEYAKKVKLTAKVTAEDIAGITAITDWNPNKLYIPYDTTHSADGIKSLILRARILINRLNAYEYDGDDISHGTNTVASSKAVADLNKAIDKAILKADAEFSASYNAMLAANTFTTNLLTKSDQKMNDYFRQDRMVNIGSQAANSWIKQVISNANKGYRKGGTLLSIGGKVQILSNLGKLAGGVLYGTIGAAITTVKMITNAIGGFVNKVFGKTIFKSKGGKGGDPGVNFYLINTMRSGGNLVYSSNYPYDTESILSSTVVWSSQDDVDNGLIAKIYFPFDLETSIFEEYRTISQLESAYYTGITDIGTMMSLQSKKIVGGTWTTLAEFTVLPPTTIYDYYPGADKPSIDTTPDCYYRIVKTDYFYRNNSNIVERAFGHTVSERIRSSNAELWKYNVAKVKYVQYFTPPWSEPQEQIMSAGITLQGFKIYNTAPNVGHKKGGRWFFDDGTYYANQENQPDISNYQYGRIRKAPNGHRLVWTWLYPDGPRYYSVCRASDKLPAPIIANHAYRNVWTTHSGGFFGWGSHKHYHYKLLYRLQGGSYLVNEDTFSIPIGATSVFSYCSQYVEFMKNPQSELSSERYVAEFKLVIIIKEQASGSIIHSSTLDMGTSKCLNITADGPLITLDTKKKYTYTIQLWKTSNTMTQPAIVYDTNISHIYYDLDGLTFPDFQFNVNYKIKI